MLETGSNPSILGLANDQAKKWIEQFSFAQMGKLNWIDRNHCFACPGTNGPHFALETPVRNTCHWLVTMLILSTWVDDKEVSACIDGMRNWLLKDNKYLIDKGVYKIRQQAGYDTCNGVIGPAWVLEALSRLYRYRSDEYALMTGEDIISRLGFNDKIGMWKRCDPITKNFRIDYTYDHQAWLAAAISDFGYSENVQKFLDKTLNGLMKLRPDGRVRHISYACTIRGVLARLAFKKREAVDMKSIDQMEKSYHHYVLFPLARLKSSFQEHDLFQSDLIVDSVRYMESVDLGELSEYPLCVSYNAPGFEYPIIALNLGDYSSGFVSSLLQVMDWQVEQTFNSTNTGCINSPDPLTLSSRIYELALFVEKYNEMKQEQPVIDGRGF